MLLSRRDWLIGFGLGGASLRCAGAATAPDEVRLGILQFGTVQWVADVIQRHHLDTAQSIALKTSMLANNDAGRIALLAGADDVIVSDWMFAATQRAGGNRLSFVPFSSALGGIMLRRESPLRGFSDLKGRKLGVAGGPTDKSWLLVQAACRESSGIDLAAVAEVIYGAPPLLSAKLREGELDAVLTFWNFAAQLEAAGNPEMISVADCAGRLGLPPQLSLVGYVFHQDWADAHRHAIDGFLKAAAAAQHILAHSDSEWERIRPLMNAPDDRVFTALKHRFIAGIPSLSPAQEEQAAERMFAILLKTGGARATSGLTTLPEGTFWHGAEA